MTLQSLLPILCCTAALILSFLCLFAGHKPSFMTDYPLVTLNVSRLAEGVVNKTLSSDSNPLSSLWDKVPSNIKDHIDDAASSVSDEIGIEDFYQAHLLDYCYGQYTPAETPNATVSASDIKKNVTGCSNQTAMFYFDPKEILEEALNKSGTGVTLEDLNWPDDIQKGLDALRIVSLTAFVLYCIAIGLIFLALIAALPALFAQGRLTACLNWMVGILAFLAIGLASALVTAVIVKGSDLVNEHGNPVGVEAQRGNKFLALTWAATGLMLITLVVWSFEICFGSGSRRSRRNAYPPAKHG
ncbi:hypothetical protein DM02DRAFT_719264 [Periconia macrospinosa]|uniref:Integral membrane protein-like protein n=1 Tax=Periconia macrospinosa TaxID=97972 RepID=A0A2V1DN61_9PLEO|nr:hypothetical protein DM02DRAFT_719264 [Periconia macrospinosa]